MREAIMSPIALVVLMFGVVIAPAGLILGGLVLLSRHPDRL
jgi:hypothetical protein